MIVLTLKRVTWMLAIAFITTMFVPPSAIALSPSPTKKVSVTPTKTVTPSVSPTVSESDIRDSIRDRLKKAAEEKSGEAEKVLDARSRRAFVGTVKDITDSTVTLTTRTGVTKLGALAPGTTVMKSGKSIKIKELAIGDAVIAMGYAGNQDVLDVRRVVVIDSFTSRNRERIYFGHITRIDAKTRVFTLSSSRPTELGGAETLEVTVPRGHETSITDLVVNDRVVLVGTVSTTDASSLTLIKLKVL